MIAPRICELTLKLEFSDLKNFLEILYKCNFEVVLIAYIWRETVFKSMSSPLISFSLISTTVTFVLDRLVGDGN